MDTQGNIYVAGGTSSTSFLAGNLQLSGNVPNSAFVASLTPTGSLRYLTGVGGSEGASANGIAVDSYNRAIIVGTAGAGFPAFTAHEFLLYESFLSPAGSRYEVRARFPLAGK